MVPFFFLSSVFLFLNYFILLGACFATHQTWFENFLFISISIANRLYGST